MTAEREMSEKLPPLPEELYEFYPAMSAHAHEQAVKVYAAALLETVAAERDALREALTPSADTKAAYIGDFSFLITLRLGHEEEQRRVDVPWTTIKEIMAAIRSRAKDFSQ